MALQDVTFSLNLGGTVDQKSDDKVADQTTFVRMKDWIRNKFKRSDKRFGTQKLPTTVSTTFPNPLTIGATDIPSSVMTHGNQLLLQNKGALYGWSDSTNKWDFKAHYYPVNAQTKTAIGKSEDLSFPSIGVLGDFVYYLFIQEIDTANHSLRLRVIDKSTGNPIGPDTILDPVTFVKDPHLVVFSNSVFVTYVVPDLAQIRIVEIDITTGAPGLPSILVSGTQPSTNIQWVVCNKVGVGERGFFVYQNSGNNTVVCSIDDTGALDATMGTYTSAVTPTTTGFGLYYSENNARLYLGYKFGKPQVEILNFTTTSITNVSTLPVASVPTGTYKNFCFIDDPTSATGVFLLVDTDEPVGYENGIGYKDKIYKQALSATALVNTAETFTCGMSLAGQPYLDTERETVYVFAQQISEVQSTLFMLDLLKGKSDGTSWVQVKTNYGDHESAGNHFLPNWALVEPRQISMLTVTKVRIAGTALPTIGIVVNDPPPDFQTGIALTKIDLAPRFAPSNAFLCGSVHTSGGYLGMYDGAEFCEHGFFIQPEFIEATTPSSTARMSFVINQHGNGSTLPEITTFTFLSGNMYFANVGPSSYFSFFPTLAFESKVGFSVDGVGTIPVGGFQQFLVPILSTDTSFEVAKKVYNTLLATGVGFSIVHNGSTVTITNNNNVNVGDAALTNMTSAATGPATGTRTFAVIWSWVDNNGLQHRSAPVLSAPLASTGFPISVIAYCPSISNREITNMRAELYATVNNGTTLHRIPDNTATWNFEASAVGFIVTAVDATIEEGEFLYTTGGVLSNNSIGACSSVSIFKNRLSVSGMDDNSIAYSKTAINGLPVEIPSEMVLVTENDGNRVTGQKQMDDKLVVFKESAISAYGGDGANSLGQGVSFSQPLEVASDAGCENQNSIEIVPSGIYFRSKMGIQHIDRSLSVTYPGIAVKDYNGDQVSRAIALRDDEDVREIRFILDSDSESIVFDYIGGIWGTFTNYAGIDACLWNGDFTRVDSEGGVYVEDKSVWIDVGSVVPSYTPVVETQWLKVKNVQDFQRIKRLMVLGTTHSPCVLQFKVFYDYNETDFDFYSFPSSFITPPDAFQPEIHLGRQKCDAIKVVMTVVPSSGSERDLSLTDVSFLCGIKRGLNKVKAGNKL